MRGQWLGRYQGTNSGRLMINVDRVADHFEGVAYMQPDNKQLPGTVVYLKTTKDTLEQEALGVTFPIHPHTGFQTTWDEIKDLYAADVSHSREAKVKLKVSGNTLHVDAVSDNNVELIAALEKIEDKAESKIVGAKMSWQGFKAYVSTKLKAGYLYRGQKRPWKLCTSFHRRGRYRISEFISRDVRGLHQRLSAITSHFFDLTVPDQNGAFFNLLQHHGYPTPLLDWSHSPFVAAFFAFRDLDIGYDGDGFVRVYLFNNRDWVDRFPQIQNLDPPFPHLSVMEFIAIDNRRMVPQQAVTTVTNLYDIEAYILDKEAETGVKFIEAIDIPASERESVMMDLRFMGITAGSMFPGIDGVCEELRERNFDQDRRLG